MPNAPTNTLLIDNLASGIDRNNGTGGRGGTKSAPGQIIVSAANGAVLVNNIPIEELADSPTIERAEQCTAKHDFRLGYDEAINRLSIYGRGALVKDSIGNYFRVLSSSVQHQEAGRALLSISTESISFDCPPDEFSCRSVKLGLDIMKHPRYFGALMPTNQQPGVADTDTPLQKQAKQTIIRAIQAYRENPVIPTTNNINGMTGFLHDAVISAMVSGKMTHAVDNPNYNEGQPATQPPPIGTFYSGRPYPPVVGSGFPPSPLNPQFYYTASNPSLDPGGKVAFAKAAAMELIGKLWRMEDTPPVSGVEITHAEYWFRPPPFNLGGYIEDPTAATPALPDYFYSTAYPPDPTKTIFDDLSRFNPQCYSITGKYNGGTKISWLRDADDMEYNRTWFKRTRKWLGAPVGAWDADLNSSANRPQVAGDYRNLVLA